MRRDGDVAAWLQRKRAELGLTQSQLGQALGVRTNTIARWERGELVVRHSRMLRLALDALRGSAPGDGTPE